MGFLNAIHIVLSTLQELGAAGRISYVLLLALYTALCLPTTPVELAAGFIFPLTTSTLLSMTGKTMGSVGALLLGRRLLRPLMIRLFHSSGSRPLRKHLLKELRERPLQTMSLMRAAPLPTPFKLYGLALLPEELVPVSSYAGVALTINTVRALPRFLVADGRHGWRVFSRPVPVSHVMLDRYLLQREPVMLALSLHTGLLST